MSQRSLQGLWTYLPFNEFVRWWQRFAVTLVFLWLIVPPAANGGESLGHVGAFAKWSTVELVLRGPSLSSSGAPNPFSILVDVEMSGPSGQSYTVPAFYDGNGQGNRDGNVWKVRFAPDEIGTWNFRSQSLDVQLDAYTGIFDVVAAPSSAPDFHRWGRLEYVGTPSNGIRYLKFRDGPYWLKAGSDDPENFLGSFSNYNTVAKRKAAIDYLASRGINSQYLIVHNIDGDNNDVWPWLGSNSSVAKGNAGNDARFDVVRLAEWRDLFQYMQTKGVAVYMVLEDDSAWSGYDHARYYRELIARFGDLPALLFNIGEEANENYTLGEALGLAQVLRDIDPYDHPIGIHNVNDPDNQYIDAAQVSFTSIQTNDDGVGGITHNARAIDWINRSKSRGRRVLVVGFDEPRPLLDRRGWWSAYIGGGVWEAHVDQPYDRPVTTWEPAWTELGGARAFMETLPFWEMEPSNSLIVSGSAFSLAKPGEAYALYLPNGGSVTVDLVAGGTTYDYAYWDPRNGRTGGFQNEGTIGGGRQQFVSPTSGDWALRVVRAGGGPAPIRPNPPTGLIVK